MKGKMVAIFATLMVTLMVAGLTYAMWTETITISGTVNTGNVDVSWTVGNGYDSETDEKDVSSISGTVSADGNTLTVTIENAYPCIDYYLPIDLHCDGSVPVIISNIAYDLTGMPTGTTVEITSDPAYPDDPVIAVGTQLEKCDTAYGLLHVHLTNDALENAQYTFSVTVTVVQWNEYTG